MVEAGGSGVALAQLPWTAETVGEASKAELVEFFRGLVRPAARERGQTDVPLAEDLVASDLDGLGPRDDELARGARVLESATKHAAAQAAAQARQLEEAARVRPQRAYTLKPIIEHGSVAAVERRENPLAGTFEQEGRNGPADELVPMDPDGAILDALRIGVGGPCRASDGTAGVHAWGFLAVTTRYCSLAFFFSQLFALVDPMLVPVGYSFATGWLVAIPCHLWPLRRLWSALGVDASGEPRALRELLRSEVSKDVAEATANTLRKKGPRTIAFTVAADTIFLAALTYVERQAFTPEVLVALVVMLLSNPGIKVMQNYGMFLAPVVACTIVEDRADRLARQIASTPATEIDFDELIRSVDALNEAIELAVSASLPVQLGNLVWGIGMGLACVAIGFGPRPVDPSHWWNAYWLPEFALAFGSGLFLFLMHNSMLGPAKITATCDKITHELNQLRKHGERLSDPIVLVKVEAVERYIERMGLGYHVLTARISFAFVYKAMGEAFSVMTVLFPIVLLQLKQSVEAPPMDGSGHGE
jgi:hypothetical protein